VGGVVGVGVVSRAGDAGEQHEQCDESEDHQNRMK
jgi:hypothetical protein